MAEVQLDAVSRCITAVVNDGMKLGLVITKCQVNIQAHTPAYQRLYRQIGKLKEQKQLQVKLVQDPSALSPIISPEVIKLSNDGQ